MAAAVIGHFDADTPLHPGTPVEDFSTCGNPVGKCSTRDMSGMTMAGRASFVGSVVSALRGLGNGQQEKSPSVPVLANTAANWEDYLNR